MFIVKLKCYLVPRLVLRTCGVEKVVWGPKPAPNMHSFWKAPPGDPVRAFVLAPLAFAHSAADRFWLADARQNRRNWRPLGEILISCVSYIISPGPPVVGLKHGDYMNKIAYILGAGFSAYADLPVMSNFIDKAKDIYFSD